MKGKPMKRVSCITLRAPWRLAVLALLLSHAPWLFGQTPGSTRVTSPTQHQRMGEGGYPYRARADYVLKELDLHPGDVVVDLGFLKKQSGRYQLA